MNNKPVTALVVIPARGGSKGIPRKNVRLLHDHPLIWYSIQNALNCSLSPHVVVSTDDDEVSRLSLRYGAEVVARPPELAGDTITLDPVIHHAMQVMSERKGVEYDVVITMQPTSPLLKVASLDAALAHFLESDVDTLISGVNRPHLSWTKRGGAFEPLYTKRVNRQYLPVHMQETGAFVISKRSVVTPSTRIGPKVSLYEVPANESVDIDTDHDWWVSEKELAKKTILFRVEGYAQIGLGHIYRALSLVYKLIDHKCIFVLSPRSDLGAAKIKASHFPYIIIEDNLDMVALIQEHSADIVVNDMLDTDALYIEALLETGVRVVNFEDLGSGADMAHAVINDLYERQREGANYYWGSDYYCMRDLFLLADPSVFHEKVTEILVLFGGTDPSDLTTKLAQVATQLDEEGVHFTFIVGMGYHKTEALRAMLAKSSISHEVVQDVTLMTDYMERADIAVSSQGRTMLELATMAVPTLLLAQNRRELHHEFGYLKNGFINLGLGSEVAAKTILETLRWLIRSPEIRRQMHDQMLSSDLKHGIQRVIDLIIGDKA